MAQLPGQRNGALAVRRHADLRETRAKRRLTVLPRCHNLARERSLADISDGHCDVDRVIEGQRSEELDAQLPRWRENAESDDGTSSWRAQDARLELEHRLDDVVRDARRVDRARRVTVAKEHGAGDLERAHA